MGAYNEELVKAGVMLAGEGLHPSSRGKRVLFSGTKRTVVDGPFAETKELIAGFWLWQVKSMEEAVEWARRCPNPRRGRVRARAASGLRDRRIRRGDDSRAARPGGPSARSDLRAGNGLTAAPSPALRGARSPVTADETHRAIEAVWRIESARLIAALTRIVRDVGLAEELAQDALVAALEQWPEEGVPQRPGAWLMATAKHRAIDRIRRNQRLAHKQTLLGRDLAVRQDLAGDELDAVLEDDRTTSATTCCA